MKFWLSRQQDESYLMTMLKPIRAPMKGEGFDWLYPQIGEPIQMELCEVGVRKMIGIELEVYESVRLRANFDRLMPTKLDNSGGKG